MDLIQKLELHYHLKEKSHSMDAVVRNKCEAEVLAVFVEIARTIGIDAAIESTAYTEGGLREIWDFISKNNNNLTLILAIIVFIFSRVPVSDPEMDSLNKEVARLTIEEKKLAIAKLKSEAEGGAISEETLSKGASVLEREVKIVARRSNFYKILVGYDKVTGVGLTPMALGVEEKYVDRSDFGRFVLATNKLPVEVIDSAIIEIVAPVITEGNYQWKGVYQGEPISFAMTDDEFKVSVLTRHVTFQHGSSIECVLNIHRKFDAVGEVTITGYSVPTVLRITDGVSQIETIQGKRFKAAKKAAEDQGKLF